MTEKTFREILPLTDEQLESLKTSDDCESCILRSPRGCYLHVGMESGVKCSEVRAEALRLDNEYKMEYLRTIANVYDSDTMSLSLLAERNMKKEILSQDEVWKIRNTFGCPSEIIQSHAASLERIADLEKQLCETKELAEYNSDFQIKTQYIIHELESRLATYEPVQMDTREDAELKAREKVAEFLRRGIDFEFRNDLFYKKYIVNERIHEPDGGYPEYFEFHYAEPREPQPGDLYYSEVYNSVFTFDAQNEEIVFARTGAAYEREKCKPIGYRVTEDGNIVPIARRSE